MSLSRKIAAALDAAPSSPARVSAEDEGRRLDLDLTATGPVGCAFSALEFSAGGPDLDPDALRGWADRVASRVTYLMEPLAFHEHDRGAGAVVLRSASPTPRADRHAFYEARLGRAGTLSLTRFAFDEAARRRAPVDCQMTREVLERLADDLAATCP